MVNRMPDYRLHITHEIANLDHGVWKALWREAARDAGHEVVSADDEIAQVLDGGEFFVVGGVK